MQDHQLCQKALEMPLEKGVYSRILGEAMYTFKCRTIKVPLVRNAAQCTVEIPVRYKEGIRYVQPITRILMEKRYIAKRINCSLFYQPLVEVEKNFWITLPSLTRADTPNMFKMTRLGSSVKFQGVDTTRLGMCAPEDLAKARTRMMFPMQGERVLAQVVGVVTRGGDAMADFELLLPMDRFRRAAKNTMYEIWGCFMWLGQVMSGLVGATKTHNSTDHVMQINT